MIDIETPEEELLQQFFEYEERLQEALRRRDCPKIAWDSSFTPAFNMDVSVPVDSEDSRIWEDFYSLSSGQVQTARDIQFLLGEMKKIIPYLRFYLIKVDISLNKLPDSGIEILSFNLSRPIKRPKRRAHIALIKSIHEELGVMAWMHGSGPSEEIIDPITGKATVIYGIGEIKAFDPGTEFPPA